MSLIWIRISRLSYRFHYHKNEYQNKVYIVLEKDTQIASIDGLLIYACFKVTENGKECTRESLIFECFTLFPKEFGLILYPEWPDSARVDKSWLRCRTDKGWLVGSVKEGFRLTEEGLKTAQHIAYKVEAKQPKNRRLRSVRTRGKYASILRYLRRSDKYLEYKTNPDTFDIDEAEFRSLLSTTLETPITVLRQNLLNYKHAASTYNDNEVSDFLTHCENMMSRILKRPMR